MKKHNWTKEDDIVAYYFCRYGFDSLLFDINTTAKKLGMAPGSMRMRVGNFKALESQKQISEKGLTHWAKLSEEIFNHYKQISKTEHLEDVKNILY
jgi:hypothetical protein